MMETPMDNSLDTTESDHGWNELLEGEISKLSSRCESYKWMHNRMSGKYRRYYNILENMVTFLQLVTTGNFFTLVFMQGDATAPLSIVGLLLTLLTAAIARFHSNKDYKGLAKEHAYSSVRWSAIANMINLSIKLDRKDRQYASEYTEWIRKTFDSQLDASPVINESIFSEFIKKFGDGDPSQKLEINIESAPKSTQQINNEKVEVAFSNFTKNNPSAKYELNRYYINNIE